MFLIMGSCASKSCCNNPAPVIAGAILDTITGIVLLVLAKKFLDQGKISFGKFKVMAAIGRVEIYLVITTAVLTSINCCRNR